MMNIYELMYQVQKGEAREYLIQSGVPEPTDEQIGGVLMKMIITTFADTDSAEQICSLVPFNILKYTEDRERGESDDGILNCQRSRRKVADNRKDGCLLL